jgi:hypothetical protein
MNHLPYQLSLHQGAAVGLPNMTCSKSDSFIWGDPPGSRRLIKLQPTAYQTVIYQGHGTADTWFSWTCRK